jgi:hypothetical protein
MSATLANLRNVIKALNFGMKIKAAINRKSSLKYPPPHHVPRLSTSIEVFLLPNPISNTHWSAKFMFRPPDTRLKGEIPMVVLHPGRGSV